jgi:ABC-type phosphate transport system substrate-binding protein
VAAGLFRVGQIASTQFKGGGGGGGAGGGPGAPSVATSGAQAAASQNTNSSNTNITLVGSTFQASQVRALIQQLNEQAGNNMNLRVQVSA